MKFSRREFLGSSSSVAMAWAAPAVLGAEKEKKYRTALIGCGWWGGNILSCAIQSGRSEVVALCDCDQKHLDQRAEKVEQATGSAAKKYKDYRELLDREKPEIVIVGTPDHWHALNTIAAVNAGAHVYVEKPVCHTVNEGIAMVRAARAADRVVQVGTHRRVSPHNISAREFIRSGKLGKIGMVRAFVLYGGSAGKPTPNSDPPPGLDWDLWCGPAPLRPFNERIHPRGFRQFLDYANGTLGDWGIHWLDQILWCMEATAPKSVASVGGRFIRKDNTDAPDTQIATFQFDDFAVSWEHRHYAGNTAEKHNVGCYFYGTEGTLHLGWQDGWTFYPASASKPTLHEDAKLNQPDGQNIAELWADFIESIEKRKRPVCDIELGHRSTTMSLLGMLALKIGRSVTWDGRKETIVNDPDAAQLLKRPYREPWIYPT